MGPEIRDVEPGQPRSTIILEDTETGADADADLDATKGLVELRGDWAHRGTGHTKGLDVPRECTH